MKRRWIGVAATALMACTGPAWAGSDAQVHAIAAKAQPDRKKAAALTASAWAALGKGDAVKAVRDAEAATLLLPRDAGARALLGRAYLAAGRFRSAETAYGDALTLDPTQARAAVNRALAQIALDQDDAARASLAAAQGQAPDADVGLAFALLGDTDIARTRLIAAARMAGADARTRQNLGLAYALEGRWTDAVAVAEQDVPADLMPQRLHRWAMIAQLKADPAMQVGAVLGILPGVDDGQPTELALVAPAMGAPEPVILAQAAPAAEPVAPVIPQVHDDNESVVTQTAITPPPLEALTVLPQSVVAAPVVLAVVPAPAEAVSKIEAWAGPPRMRTRAAKIVEVKPPAVAAVATTPALAAPKLVKLARNLSPGSAKPKPIILASQTLLKSPLPKFAGKWAVQLGAFSTVSRTEIAWSRISSRAVFLNAHMPTGSKMRRGNAMVHRLSVAGFASRAEATRLCLRVKAVGAACFVRPVRDDRPMQWAARMRTGDTA